MSASRVRFVSRAAAVVLAPAEEAKKFTDTPVEVVASSVATDTLSLYQRKELTIFEGSRKAADEAFKRAHLTANDIDVLEVHDAFSVLGLMALEDLGFADKGTGAKLLLDGTCNRDGKVPTNTFGGLKARGHPVGASGMYQVAELALQLSNRAEKCQVRNASVGLSQSVGGIGSTVVVHILRSL